MSYLDTRTLYLPNKYSCVITEHSIILFGDSYIYKVWSKMIEECFSIEICHLPLKKILTWLQRSNYFKTVSVLIDTMIMNYYVLPEYQ